MINQFTVLSTVILLAVSECLSPAGVAARFEELRRLDAPEAVQAMAVDPHHIFAIANAAILKHVFRTGAGCRPEMFRRSP